MMIGGYWKVSVGNILDKFNIGIITGGRYGVIHNVIIEPDDGCGNG